MAQAFLTNIDLSDNQLQNFRVHNTPNSSAPTSLAGMMYYDTATNLMKYYNGATSTWETFGTATGGVTSFSTGSTGLTPSAVSTGAISLAGTLVVANGGTGATTLTGLIRGNGTLPFTAAAAGTDYEVPLSFTTGLTRAGNTVTVNASQNISTLSNLTSNGFVTTSGGTGALSVTTLGSGVATFLSTPNSANLASAVTDETGSGALVFATSPSLTTPSLAGETFSTTNNVTAGTNAQGQGALTTDINVITTAAANPSGVTLPTATQGRKILIVNKGANAVNVYPATGATIDGLSVNAAISLPVNGLLEFNASSTTQWYSSFQSTVTGTGVTSFSGGTTGLSPNTASTGPVTLAGTLAVANGGTGVTTSTGSGSVVLSTSPSLTTPILGIPQSGTLTSCTGLPVSTGISGLGTNVATFLATPSSANLAAALTDETGTGANVFANTPTLVTPILGTPTSVTLTNATGLPLNTGVTGTLPVANGGTGTNTGSITGTGTLTFTAGGTNTNVSLAPNGTGTVDVNSTRITNLANPETGTDAATKNYVDNLSAGLSWKASVIAATVGTESFIISSGAVTQITGTTLDGQSPGVNDRILIKNAPAATGTGSSPETNQPANGIYIVTNATTNLTVSRASDADTAAELLQSVVFVRQGSTNADNAFVLTTDTITTLNTTPLLFTTFSSATVPDATTSIKGKVELATKVETEAKSSTTLVVTPESLSTFARKYTATIGNGSSTSIAVTHGLGSQYVTAQVFDDSSKKQVYCDVTLTSETQTTFGFAVAPTTNQYRVVITG